MKTIILLLICITSFAFSQEKLINDWTKMNLKGKVKSVRTVISHNTRTQTETGWDSEIFFNQDGYIVETKQYFGNGILFSTETYKYDNKNNIIENSNDSRFGIVTVKKAYDSNNFLITDSIFKYSEKWTELINYKNDKNGNLIMKFHKTNNSEIYVMYDRYNRVLQNEIDENYYDYYDKLNITLV